MENQLEQINNRLTQIEERNKRVEAEKAWETSLARKVCIIVTTYLITSLVFWIIGIEGVFLNALIPTVAYSLSTLSFPMIKYRWLSIRSNHPE